MLSFVGKVVMLLAGSKARAGNRPKSPCVISVCITHSYEKKLKLPCTDCIGRPITNDKDAGGL
jgi:hypothetical protein